MKNASIRLVAALLLACLGSAAQALVFAVNEGVTYRVTNDEIRARYADSEGFAAYDEAAMLTIGKWLGL